MDTGSNVTTITESFYRENLKDKTVEDASWIGLKAGNGLDIPVIGLFIGKLEVNGTKVCEDAYILVVKDPIDFQTKQRKTNVPGVLGSNILNKIYSFCFENKSSTKVNSVLETLSSMYQTQIVLTERVEARLKVKGDIGIARASVGNLNPVKIPAEGTYILSATTSFVPDGYPVLLEGVDCNVPGLIVHSSMTRVEKNRVEIPVLNVSKKDIILKQPFQLAALHSAKSLMPFLQLEQTSDGLLLSMSESTDSIDSVDDSWIDQIDFNKQNLSDAEISKFTVLLKKFRHAFSQTDADFGCTNLIEHSIKLVDSVPIRLSDRTIPPNLLPEVRTILEDWIQQGVIKESHSPYASQIALARKKNGKIRVCIDFRQLNKKTYFDSYPLPKMNQCIEALKGSQYFSALDLSSGYLQVPIKEEDKEKTAFRALGSLYEFERMPFGLCNAPMTFSRLMDKTFGDYKLEDWLELFLDDILVHTATFDQMLYRLELVFSRLTRYGLKLQPSKCHFFQSEVVYLGHRVSRDGIRPDESKVEAVVDFPIPKTVKDVKSFLGLASYYRRFIKNFATIASPLTKLTAGLKKGTKGSSSIVQWSDVCQKSFDSLKEKLVSADVMTYPDFNLPFILETDASLQGYGAVLSQVQDGKCRVIAYASKQIKAIVKGYSSFKLEFDALHWAVTKKFHDYLIGSVFVVYTDSNPLSNILGGKKTAADMGKLASLSDYNFSIRYRSGKLNSNADALSRNCVGEVCEESSHVLIEACYVREFCLLESKQLSNCTAICDSIQSVCANQLSDCSVSAQSVYSEGAIGSDIESSCIIPSFEHLDILKLQSQDSMLSTVIDYVKSGERPSVRDLKGFSPTVKKLFNSWDRFVIEKDLLYRKVKINGIDILQLMLPSSLYHLVLEYLHDKMGHQGVERTTELILSRFYWYDVHSFVKKYVKACTVCQISKPELPKPKSRMSQLKATKPNELLCIDFLTLDKSSSGFENVLIMTDCFSKFSKAIATKDQTAITVANVLLEEWFNVYGVPARLHSDQGRNFESQIIQQLCLSLGVQKSRTTAYHPQGNGQSERFNSTLINLIRTLPAKEKKVWPMYLKQLSMCYNSTTHSSTGFSPYFLFFGRSPILPIDLILDSALNGVKDMDIDSFVKEKRNMLLDCYEKALLYMTSKFTDRKKRHDRKYIADSVPIGSRVLLRKRYIGRCKIKNYYDDFPYVIVSINKDENGCDVYTIKPVVGGDEKKIHRENFRVLNGILDSESVVSDDSDEEEFVPRRSSRSTKGINPNVYNLPKSVLGESVFHHCNVTLKFN